MHARFTRLANATVLTAAVLGCIHVTTANAESGERGGASVAERKW